MAMNDAAAPGHVCRGIRIHAIDIVQPPGMGITIADIEAHQTIVTAALVAKSSSETPKRDRSEPRLEFTVLISPNGGRLDAFSVA
jgi:hypothetical protein